MSAGPIPSIGRIVHYTLSEYDVEQIAAQRKLEAITADNAQDVYAKARRGNTPEVGDVYPMLITRVWGDTPESSVNGQVFLDGNDVLWATSACVGHGPHTFAWPARA